MPRIRTAYTYTEAQASAVYSRHVHTYGFKPTPIISYRNRESANALTIGVEDEVDMTRDTYSLAIVASAAQAVTDIADGRVYLKRDGSLNYGFEIVSHPATLASHMYDAHWSGILNKCIRHGLRSHDTTTCGLHLHVGRAQLGRTDEERDEVVRKVKVLVYRHWREVVRFSRRTADRMNMWASRELSDCFLENLAEATDPAAYASRHIETSNAHSDRYIAVNCENSATIEFRVFRGTLKRDTLMASMQFVSNVCKYAMAHTWEECLASSFLEVALYERFNEIETYLIARGLADDTCTGRVQNTQRTYSHGGTDGVEG